MPGLVHPVDDHRRAPGLAGGVLQIITGDPRRHLRDENDAYSDHIRAVTTTARQWARLALGRPDLRRLQGEAGIRRLGHRSYVGGQWDEIGALQLHFMVEQGLRPNHVFLDIACGALRGGVHFIPYLETAHYLGIDKEPELIKLGIEHELTPELLREKRPEFVVSDTFEFGRFSQQPDVALAQSLFTHLPGSLVSECLVKLRSFAPDSVLFASFREGRRPRSNLKSPCDHLAFFYTPNELESLAHRAGWCFRYLGQWGHPRGLAMAAFYSDPRAGHADRG